MLIDIQTQTGTEQVIAKVYGRFAVYFVEGAFPWRVAFYSVGDPLSGRVLDFKSKTREAARLLAIRMNDRMDGVANVLVDGNQAMVGVKLNGRDEEGFTPSMRRHSRAAVVMHIVDEARATGHSIKDVLMSHTLDSASEVLGVSRSTVKRMRKRLGIAGPVQA